MREPTKQEKTIWLVALIALAVALVGGLLLIFQGWPGAMVLVVLGGVLAVGAAVAQVVSRVKPK